NMLVRRIGVNELEVVSILRCSVLRHPVARYQKLVIAKHVEQRITTNYGAEQIRSLSQRRAHKQTAIAGAADGQALRRGVFVLNQPLGSSDEVIENVLLLFPHAGVMPGFTELRTSTQVRQRVDSATINPGRGKRIEAGHHGNVKPAVAGEQRGMGAI